MLWYKIKIWRALEEKLYDLWSMNREARIRFLSFFS